MPPARSHAPAYGTSGLMASQSVAGQDPDRTHVHVLAQSWSTGTAEDGQGPPAARHAALSGAPHASALAALDGITHTASELHTQLGATGQLRAAHDNNPNLQQSSADTSTVGTPLCDTVNLGRGDAATRTRRWGPRCGILRRGPPTTRAPCRRVWFAHNFDNSGGLPAPTGGTCERVHFAAATGSADFVAASTSLGFSLEFIDTAVPLVPPPMCSAAAWAVAAWATTLGALRVSAKPRLPAMLAAVNTERAAPAPPRSARRQALPPAPQRAAPPPRPRDTTAATRHGALPFLEETEARLTQKQRAADQHSSRRYEQFAAYERSHGCRHHNDPRIPAAAAARGAATVALAPFCSPLSLLLLVNPPLLQDEAPLLGGAAPRAAGDAPLPLSMLTASLQLERAAPPVTPLSPQPLETRAREAASLYSVPGSAGDAPLIEDYAHAADGAPLPLRNEAPLFDAAPLLLLGAASTDAPLLLENEQNEALLLLGGGALPVLASGCVQEVHPADVFFDGVPDPGVDSQSPPTDASFQKPMLHCRRPPNLLAVMELNKQFNDSTFSDVGKSAETISEYVVYLASINADLPMGSVQEDRIGDCGQAALVLRPRLQPRHPRLERVLGARGRPPLEAGRCRRAGRARSTGLLRPSRHPALLRAALARHLRLRRLLAAPRRARLGK